MHTDPFISGKYPFRTGELGLHPFLCKAQLVARLHDVNDAKHIGMLTCDVTGLESRVTSDSTDPMRQLRGRCPVHGFLHRQKYRAVPCSSPDLGTLLLAGLQKISIDSLVCSFPRKSLVKGARFMRGKEEKPE